MAVLAMQRIRICALKENRKAILEILQRQGSVEIEDFGDFDKDAVFLKEEKPPISAAEFEKSLHEAENALSVLSAYSEEKAGLLSSLAGRKIMTVEEYEAFSKEASQVSKSVDKIMALAKANAEMRADIIRCEQQTEMLEPWKSLDIPLNITGTEKTAFFVGTLPSTWTLDQVYELLAMQAPVDVEIVSSSREQTCIVVICHGDKKEEVSAVLKSNGFSYPAFEGGSTPTEKQDELRAEIERLNSEIVKNEDEIRSMEDKTEQIKFYEDYISMMATRYAAASRMPQSDHTFILTGYAPKDWVPGIEAALADYPVDISVKDVTPKENCPTILKNNPFSWPMEGIVASYSLPSRRDIDPAFLMSLFYYILFGFMLSDAAFGLIIFVACLILIKKFPNMEKGFKMNIELFMIGGISAIFWGVMYGSYFGDLVTQVSSTFFGHEVTIPPLWVDMQESPMTVLTLSLCIGVIHIFVGMGIQSYQFIKRKDWIGFIFDDAAWYLILIGLILKLLAMELTMGILLPGHDPIVPSNIGNIGLIVAAIGAVGVLFMGGRESKNPGKRLIKGAYAVYGITSYFSDILSYCRLLALGLATGVICSVANMIGTMFGGGVVGIIVYLFVFVIINALNLFINGFGAYVHTNRLMYVEFFNRFYEGGGREFHPYSVNTKYYKFQ